MTTVPGLVTQRDESIRLLWLAFRALSDQVEMTDEDAELFELVSRHSTIQNALKPSPRPTNPAPHNNQH